MSDPSVPTFSDSVEFEVVKQRGSAFARTSHGLIEVSFYGRGSSMVAAILYDGQWKKLIGSSVEALLEEERRRSVSDSEEFDTTPRNAAALQLALDLNQDSMDSQRSKKESDVLRALEMEAVQTEAVESQAIVSAQNDAKAQEAAEWMQLMIEELLEKKRMLDMRGVTLEKCVRDLEMEMKDQEETKAELHETLRKGQSTSFTLTGPELEDNKRFQNALQTKLDELEEVTQVLAEKLNELMEELMKTRHDCEDVSEQIEDIKWQASSAQSEPSELLTTSSTDPTSSSTASFAPYNTQTTSLLTSSLAQHDRDQDQDQDQIKELRTQIAAQEEELEESQAARASIERSVAALSAELDPLRATLEEEMMKKSKLTTKLDSLSSESEVGQIASLQREMEYSDALIQALHEKLDELELVRDELLTKLANLAHVCNNIVTQLLKDRNDLENLVEQQHSKESFVSLPSNVGVEAPLRRLSISKVNAQAQSDDLAVRQMVEPIEETKVLRAAMMAREEAMRAEEEAMARKAMEARQLEIEQEAMTLALERRRAEMDQAMVLALERRRAEMEQAMVLALERQQMELEMAMLGAERQRRQADEERTDIARSMDQELDERRREHEEMARRMRMEQERLRREVADVREAMNRLQGNLSQEQKERFNS